MISTSGMMPRIPACTKSVIRDGHRGTIPGIRTEASQTSTPAQRPAPRRPAGNLRTTRTDEGEEGKKMSTSVEENKLLVQRFGEAMNNRQFDLLDEIVAPDFVRHCQATPDVDVRSLEAFKGYLRQDATVFPDSVQTLRHQVAEGDFVAVWVTYEGTQKGPMGPFPPSGKKMHLEFGAFLRLRNGKISEMWVTWDNMAALAQLGHLATGPGTTT
jgi:steroid delta-isomerase-like uncharacterized protein